MIEFSQTKWRSFARKRQSFHSILVHRSLGGPIDIFTVTVTSVHAVADLTEKMCCLSRPLAVDGEADPGGEQAPTIDR